MAAGNKVGHPLGTSGALTDIDGPTSVSTSNGLGQRNALGTRVFDDNGNEYIYLSGVASCAAGDWVQYNNATAASPWIAVRLVTTASMGSCAVAMSACVALCFGWFQIFGLTPTNTAIATDAAADGKSLSAGSATGRVQTGPVTTKNIFGAVAVGASAANVGTAFIVYPYEFGSATI